MNEDHPNPQASTEMPSAVRQKPRGAMGLRFSRRFRLLRSGATYNALVESEPRIPGRTYPPSRKELRDAVRARRLKNNGRVLETHPEFVPQATASASSSPESSGSTTDLLEVAMEFAADEHFSREPRWQHQCHICRNETTGMIDEELGCDTCQAE